MEVTRYDNHDGTFTLSKLTGNFSGFANATVSADGTILSAQHCRRTGKTRQMFAYHKARLDTPVGLNICRAVREHLARSQPKA